MAAICDPYEVLAVRPGADPAEIRAAFRALIAACHPDRSAAPDAHDRSAAIIAAYRTLSCGNRRRIDRDRRGARGPVPPREERRDPRRGDRRTGRAASFLLEREEWRTISRLWTIVALLIVLATVRPLLEPAEDFPVGFYRAVSATPRG